jgi:membrane-associated protease RseP (regulator of RpoE activity)
LALSLLLVYAVHEAGHALAARLCGVPVAGFAFGCGPLLHQWQGRGLIWRWRLWPVAVKVLIARADVVGTQSRWLALGGPLAGLLLVPISLALFLAVPGLQRWAADLCAMTLIVNLLDLLPLPILDGGYIWPLALFLKRAHTVR